jgi:hypothetical protein
MRARQLMSIAKGNDGELPGQTTYPAPSEPSSSSAFLSAPRRDGKAQMPFFVHPLTGERFAKPYQWQDGRSFCLVAEGNA